MEENLFRAKRAKNNEWVEGDEIQSMYKMFLLSKFVDEGFREIHPKTLCRFTGLHDKNGERIFEYDIVKRLDYNPCDVNFPSEIGIIKMFNGMFYVSRIDIEDFNIALCNYNEKVEVIGNVFDNPELLG